MLKSTIKKLRYLALLFCVSVAPIALAREEVADVLTDPALNMKRPADRAKAVGRMKIIEDRRLQNAQARGRALGIPLVEALPNGGTRELVDFDAEGPVFRVSRNTNAAISTGANLTWTSPHTLNGNGIIVGVWDSGMGRPTHQEFATGSRLVSIDGSTMGAHSMHVAGTIGALGVSGSSRGMANAAKIHSYTSSSDKSEMTAAGASSTGQTATKIHTSNHSYGPSDGWRYTTKWVWGGTGTDQNGYDINFGQYSSSSRSIDSTIYTTPYLASFWACGNDRTDGPSNGNVATVGGVDVTYNSAIHPQGDGVYRGGYETINAESIGKNSIAIGAVNDAVTSGIRDTSKATIASFSSTGPADDGRIKPDLVANGVGLTSTDIVSDTSYTSMSGTSMASPNACGSATLLVEQYNRLCGSAMRASTLKALLIHTADDIGRPGPDYFFGWGLVNVKKGADLVASHAAYPTAQQITESSVSTTTTSREYSFVWDGSSAISATIAWTDPAATAVTTHDSRTPVLVNNLNLKIIAPNGTEYFPYTMPFVGTWTVASMSANATTGVNNVDNVEQVRVATPGQTGIWRAQVGYTGTITNTTQDFGLILSGLSADKTLVLNLAASSVSEAAGDGATTGTVSRVGTSGDLVVSLASGNTSKITVPAFVTILNGQATSPPFNVNAVDDLVIESTQTVTLTASTSGYQSGTANIDVTDNDNIVPVVNAGTDQTVFLNGASPTLGWSYSAWTSDATSGVSDQLTYTAAHCFGNNHASVTVNNVTFTESFSTSGTGWSVGGTVANWEGDDNVAVTGTSEDLAEEFIYSGSPRTVTFTGLTAGQAYEAIFYSAGWDPVDPRVHTFSGTSQTPLVLNQNFYGDNNGIKISCVYMASGTSQTFTITPTTGTFHLYAMLNRGIPLSSATANLDGTVSDGNGHTLTTAWTLLSGPAGAAFGDAALVDTTATFNVAGTYTLRLTANDGFSQAADDVVVHVNPAGSGYMMTYAGNGSTGGSIPVDGTQYTLNATVTVLGNTGSLTRTGFNFTGWNTAADGSGTSYAPAATFSINTNTTLHAQWTAVPTYTVSFDGNGSTGGSVSNQTKTQNVDLTLSGPGTLVRTGYGFSNWNTQPDGFGTSYTAGAIYTANAAITLYAQWTLLPTYTVSFDGNGNTGGSAPADQTKIHDSNLVLSGGGTLSKTGHSFAGWNTANNGSGTSYAAGANYSINAGMLLYAQWNALPVVSAGPDQTLFLTGSAWSPLDLAPKLWLDANDTATITLNGATVSQWSDKSGFGRHATATGTSQPTATAAGLNGKRVVTFDGATDVLNVDLDFFAGVSHSAFIVTKPTIYSNIYGAATGSAGANSLHVGFNGNNYRMNYWGNDYGPARTANFVAGSANIMNYVWTTGISKQILANGKSEGTNTNAGTISTMSGGGRIGRTTGHAFFGGDIAEFIAVTGAVSAANRQKLEGFLAHKWGLTNRLDAAHPYKSSSPDSTEAIANLDGTVSDADGDALTTTWTMVSGPAGVTLGNASAVDTTATFNVAGTYTFRLTANDGFTQISDDVVITINPAASYNVTYAGNNSTGGSVPVDASSPYSSGITVTVLGNTGSLVRSGYAFNNWNTAANGTGTSYNPGQTFSISSSTTLYAQWTANSYTVNFDSNGGIAATPTSKSVTFDASYGTLASTTRAGFSFTGWFTAASGGTPVTSGATVSTTADHTLYAQWIQNGVLTLTSGDLLSSGTFGGTFSPSSKEYTLQNTGGESIDWSVVKAASWAELSVTSGTLAPGASATVTVSINAAALAPGSYNDTVTFTNTTNGLGNTTRGVALTVLSVYQAWANGFLPADVGNPAGNDDGDTLSNLLEFAFGTDPTVSSSAPIAYTPGGNVISPGAPVPLNLATGGGVDFGAMFGRRKNHQVSGLTYTVQFSADFTNWVTSTDTPTVLTGVNSVGDIEAVYVPFPLLIPTASGDKKPTFFRVGVSGN